MVQMNLWAVLVAAIASFVASSVWYVIFGKQMAGERRLCRGAAKARSMETSGHIW